MGVVRRHGRGFRVFAVLALVIGLLSGATSASAGFAEPYSFVTKWGSTGSGNGQFDLPGYVTVDASGNVYVADVANFRIQKFDSSGNFTTKWGSEGSGDGQFTLLGDVATDGSGNVYVTDWSLNRVQKFDSSGNFITKWGTFGSGDGQFWQPLGIAVDASGNVYVADQLNDRIQKFDSSGNFISKWGTTGSGDGEFDEPHDVAVDRSGEVLVADFGNHRIQRFDSSGAFISKWGSLGAGDGQFDRPTSVAVDSLGNVYVADEDHRIQKFTGGGSFLTVWGRLGTGDGEFATAGIAIDSAGFVYVADHHNDRIQKFAGAAFTDHRVGVGTRTPASTVHVRSASPWPGLRLEDAGSSPQSWVLRVRGDSDAFQIRDLTSGTTPLEIESGASTDALVVDSTSRVGVGTPDPTALLTVAGDNARISVERTGPEASRTLFDMANDGRVFFRIQDRTKNDGWEFGTRGSGFEVNLSGSGGSEFRFFDNGKVTMGPGPATNFELSPTGDLEVAGTITDGSGNTLGDLAAENEALRDRIADLEARLAALEEAMAQVDGG